jgi:CBS domain-containing protein
VSTFTFSAQEERMKDPKLVADIMTREVITLNEEDNLADLEYGMTRERIRHLPVVDGRKLVGLITHRDLLRAAASKLGGDAFVARLMTRNPTTIRPDATLGDAARVLAESKFGCLPVIDAGGELVGIVTEHDFVKLFAMRSA